MKHFHILLPEEPLDEVPVLLASRIPSALVYGGADINVPYVEKRVNDLKKPTVKPDAPFGFAENRNTVTIPIVWIILPLL